jgi:hypothetical protein
MCENRERLIGYVYGESAPDEKRAIEEHLTTCHVCRDEIRGLRSVRQDLLAWEVPSVQPIWRPVAPEQKVSPWQAVPAWGLAAAACAILMVGAVGGAATYALLPHPPAAIAEATPPAVPAVSEATAPVDVAAIEARLLERMRSELDTRLQVVSASTSREASSASATTDLTRRVNALTARQDELSRLLIGVANETIGIRTKQSGLEHDNRLLVSYMQGQGPEVFRGGR